MQKTWRMADVTILLVLLLTALIAGLVLFQQQRTHLRVNDLETRINDFSGVQHEVQSRLSELSDNVSLMEQAISGQAETGRSPAGAAPVDSDTSAPASADDDDEPQETDSTDNGDDSASDDNGNIQFDDEHDVYGFFINSDDAAEAESPAESPVKSPVKLREPSASEKRGDWLIRHLSAEPATLNPLTGSDAYASIVNNYIFDDLADRDLDTLQWYGKLAETWEISPDGLTITFKLRPNITWSDGVPITAHDAVFSYRLMMNETVLAMRLRSYFSDVKSVRALDDRTLQFEFSRPYFLAFEIAASMTIIPRHIYGAMSAEEFNSFRGDGRGAKLVGSGPYVLERWTQNEVRLTRNNRYYGQAPNFDKVILRVVRDDNVVYQMLQAGQLDFVGLTPEQWEKAVNDPQIQRQYDLLSFSIPSGYNYIAWNNNHPIFQDPVVRRAMTHLVPRELIRDEVFSGMAQIVTGPFWPGNERIKVPLQYNHDIRPWPYDQKEALRLLASSGWRDSDGDGILDKDGRKFSFRLMLPGAGVWSDIASAIKEKMAQVGIEMEVRQMEWTMFVKNLDERSYDAIALAWTGSLEGDPVQIWHSDSIKNQGSNHVSYSNKEVDEILMKARRTLDQAERNALYHRFHEILHQQQPYTFLYTNPARRAVHKRFENVVIYSLNLDDRQWWVPAEKRKYGK